MILMILQQETNIIISVIFKMMLLHYLIYMVIYMEKMENIVLIQFQSIHMRLLLYIICHNYYLLLLTYGRIPELAVATVLITVKSRIIDCLEAYYLKEYNRVQKQEPTQLNPKSRNYYNSSKMLLV